MEQLADFTEVRGVFGRSSDRVVSSQASRMPDGRKEKRTLQQAAMGLRSAAVIRLVRTMLHTYVGQGEEDRRVISVRTFDQTPQIYFPQ